MVRIVHGSLGVFHWSFRQDHWVSRVFDHCVILYEFHIRRWASVVPYCLKKGLKAEIQKKVTVGDGCSVATLHLPLLQLVSSGRLLVFGTFALSPSQAIGGTGVAVLSGRGDLKKYESLLTKAWMTLKSQRNRAKFPSANGAWATVVCCNFW